MTARAEMAYAFAYRAQAGDAIFCMGAAGVGDTSVQCVELGLAAGPGGDGGRRGGQQCSREKGRKSLFHHACLLFFRCRPVWRGKVRCRASMGASPGARFAWHIGARPDFGPFRAPPARDVYSF